MAMSFLICLFFVTFSANSVVRAEKVEIRVMNYNVRQLPIILGLWNKWDQSERLKRLPGAIRRLQSGDFGEFPEVMFFNELMTSDSHWKIKDEFKGNLFPYQTSVAGATCKVKETETGHNWDSIKGKCDIFSARSGVMAISSLEIKEKHAYIFRSCDKHTWDCKANKGAVYIKVVKGGRFFHLVGTHLQADEVGDEETAQAVRFQQMQELKEWLEEFNIPKEEPVIVIGDLNVEYGYPSADLVDQNTYQFDFENDFGYGSFSAPTNWLARADAFHNGYDMNYDRTLDYIAAFKDHKLPMEPAWMQIYQLQAAEKWYWDYLHRDFDVPGEGIISHNGWYNEVSDHWPVAATYSFSF